MSGSSFMSRSDPVGETNCNRASDPVKGRTRCRRTGDPVRVKPGRVSHDSRGNVSVFVPFGGNGGGFQDSRAPCTKRRGSSVSDPGSRVLNNVSDEVGAQAVIVLAGAISVAKVHFALLRGN